jgi:hypothetical protein
MITAMQMMLDDLISKREVYENAKMYQCVATLETSIEIAKHLLEKEKEQIIDAGNACSIKTIVHRENLDKMSEDELRNSLVEDTISHGEDYYNQTYKPETI